MSRPKNWYDMSNDERRAWEKTEREREDAEYEADRAKRRAEQAESDLRRRQREQAAEREEHGYELQSAQEEADGLREELRKVKERQDELLQAAECVVEALRGPLPVQPANIIALLQGAIDKAKGVA